MTDRHPPKSWGGVLQVITAGCLCATLLTTLPVHSALGEPPSSDVSAQEGSIAIKGPVNTGGGSITATAVYGLDVRQVQELMLVLNQQESPSVAKVAELSNQLGVTDSALKTFFRILGEQEVPTEQLLAKLEEIANRHKGLQTELATFESDDPVVLDLKKQASQAIEQGVYDHAEALLQQAEAADLKAAERMQTATDQRLLGAAKTRKERGTLKETQLAYPEAAEHFRMAAELVPASAPLVRADYLNELGPILVHIGRTQEAQSAFNEALAIQQAKLGPDHLDVAKTLLGLVMASQPEGRTTEAGSLLERALTILETGKEPDPAHLKLLAGSLVMLAIVRETAPILQGRHLPGAELLAERALKTLEKVSAPDDPEFAAGLSGLAMIYLLQNRLAEAEAFVKRALAIQEKTRSPDHYSVATSLGVLAMVYNKQNHSAEATPLFRRAVTSLEKSFGPNHPFIATLSIAQGIHLVNLNQPAEGGQLIERGLTILEKTDGDKSPFVVLAALPGLALARQGEGRLAEAEALGQRALRLQEEVFGRDHPIFATTSLFLAHLYLEQGSPVEARPLLEGVLEIKEPVLGPNHPEVVTLVVVLAQAHQAEGHLAEAEALYRRVLATEERTLDPNHRNLAIRRAQLARLYYDQGRYAEAEALLKRALAIAETTFSPDDPTLETIRNNYKFLVETIDQAKSAGVERE